MHFRLTDHTYFTSYPILASSMIPHFDLSHLMHWIMGSRPFWLKDAHEESMKFSDPITRRGMRTTKVTTKALLRFSYSRAKNCKKKVQMKHFLFVFIFQWLFPHRQCKHKTHTLQWILYICWFYNVFHPQVLLNILQNTQKLALPILQRFWSI